MFDFLVRESPSEASESLAVSFLFLVFSSVDRLGSLCILLLAIFSALFLAIVFTFFLISANFPLLTYSCLQFLLFLQFYT